MIGRSVEHQTKTQHDNINISRGLQLHFLNDNIQAGLLLLVIEVFEINMIS